MKVNAILSGAIIVGISACHPMTNDAVAGAQSSVIDSVENAGKNSIDRPPEFIKYDASGSVILNSAAAFVSYSDLQVQNKLSFYGKIKRHAEILDRIGQAQLQAKANLDAAADTKNLDDYRAAQQDMNNVEKILLPYSIAQEQAERLIRAGFKLRDFSGNACLISDCEEIDPMVAFFFFTGNRVGLDQNLADQASAASQPNDPDVDVQVDGLSLTALFYFLSDNPLDSTTSDVLPSLRRAVEKPLGSRQHGELTNLIIKPGEHPVEIVQDIGNNIISPRDHSDIAKITKEPIKCTVGKVFQKC